MNLHLRGCELKVHPRGHLLEMGRKWSGPTPLAACEVQRGIPGELHKNNEKVLKVFHEIMGSCLMEPVQSWVIRIYI